MRKRAVRGLALGAKLFVKEAAKTGFQNDLGRPLARIHRQEEDADLANEGDCGKICVSVEAAEPSGWLYVASLAGTS